jgi:pyruvate kinase
MEEFLRSNTANHEYFSLTKICATIGPASNNYEKISFIFLLLYKISGDILNHGVSYVRMNFSHASYEFHSKIYEMIRKASLEVKNHVAVVIDLQGPKLRCNNFVNGSIIVERGEDVLIIVSKEDGKQGVDGGVSVITTSFEPMIRECNVKEPVLFDDGLIRMIIKEKKPDGLIATVVQGGLIIII